MTTHTQTHIGLIRICSWCKRMMDDESKSFGSHLLAWMHSIVEGDKISHGLCQSCAVIERKKLAAYKSARKETQCHNLTDKQL